MGRYDNKPDLATAFGYWGGKLMIMILSHDGLQLITAEIDITV
jgi:hypothetical protein